MKGSREHQRKMVLARQKYLEDKYSSSTDKSERKTKAKRRAVEKDEDLLIQQELQQEMDQILERCIFQAMTTYHHLHLTVSSFRPVDESFLRNLESSLRPDDDVAWMAITPAEVDDLLAQKQKEFDAFEAKETERKVSKIKKKECDNGRKTETGSKEGDAQMLMELIGGMKHFMGKISSFEGAEFPTLAEKEESSEISFDADRFMRVMQQALEGGAPHEIEEETDEDSEEEPDEFFGMGSDEV